MGTKIKTVLDALQQMHKCLECSICLELLSDPHSTRCNHQFCGNCIRQVIEKSSKTTKNAWFCPLCKTPVSRRSLTRNPRLGEIVAAVRHLHDAIKQDVSTSGSPPALPVNTHCARNKSRCSESLSVQSVASSLCSDNQNIMEPPEEKQRTSRRNMRRAANSRNRVVTMKNSANRSNRVDVSTSIYVEEQDIHSLSTDCAGSQTSEVIKTNTNISSSFNMVQSGKKAVKLRKGKPPRKNRRLSKRDVSANIPLSPQAANEELCHALESMPLATLDQRDTPDPKTSSAETKSGEIETPTLAGEASKQVDLSKSLEMETNELTKEGVPLLEKSTCLTTVAEADSSVKSPCIVVIPDTKPTGKDSVKSCETTVTSSKAEPCSDESMESVSIFRNLSTFNTEENASHTCSEIIDKTPAHHPLPTVLTNRTENPAQTDTFSRLDDRGNKLQSTGHAVCNSADTKESESRPSLNVTGCDTSEERLATDKQTNVEESLTQVAKKTNECREKKVLSSKTLERSAVVCMCKKDNQDDKRFYSESELLVKMNVEENTYISVATTKPQQLQASDSLQVNNEDNSYSYKKAQGVKVPTPQQQRMDSNNSGYLQSASETAAVEGNLGSSASLFYEPLEKSAFLQNTRIEDEESSSQKEVRSFNLEIKISETNETIPSLNINKASEEKGKLTEHTTCAMPKDLSESIIDDSDLCERVKRRQRRKTQVMQLDEGQICSSQELSNLPKSKKKKSLDKIVPSQEDEFSNPQQKKARNLYTTLDDNTMMAVEKSQDNKSRSVEVQQDQDVNGLAVNKHINSFHGRQNPFENASSGSSSQSVEEIVPASIPSLEDSAALVIDPMIPHNVGSCHRTVTASCLSQPTENTSGENLNDLDKLPCSDVIVAESEDSILTHSEKEHTKRETPKNVTSSDNFQSMVRKTFVQDGNHSHCQTEPKKSLQIMGTANRVERTKDVSNSVISPQNKTQDTEDDDLTLDSYTSSDTPMHYCIKEDPTTPCLFGDDSVTFTSPERTCNQRNFGKFSLRTKRNKLTRNRNSKFFNYSLESPCDDEGSFSIYPSSSSAEFKSNDSCKENSASQSISVLQDLDYTVLGEEMVCQQHQKNPMGDRIVEISNINTASDEEPSPKRLKCNHESNSEPEEEGYLRPAREDDTRFKSETTQNENDIKSSLSAINVVEGFKTPRMVYAQIRIKSRSTSSDETEDDTVYPNTENKVVKGNMSSQDLIMSGDFRLLRPLSQSLDGIDGSCSQDDIIPPTPPLRQHGVNISPQLASHKVISTTIYRETHSPVCVVTEVKKATFAMEIQTDLSGLTKRRNHREESQEPKQKRVCIINENASIEGDTLKNLQEVKTDIGTASNDTEHRRATEMNTRQQHDSVEAGQDEEWKDSPTDELLLEPAFVQNEKAEMSSKEIHQRDDDLDHDSDCQEDGQDLREYNAVSYDSSPPEAHDVGQDEDICNLHSQTSSQESSQILSVSGHLDTTGASSFLSDAPVSTQKMDKLKELVLDKEQEMEALERYIASCNKAKEQVMRQMDSEESESEKDSVDSEDDTLNEEDLCSQPSPTPPPPLSPRSIPPPRQLPSPLRAVSEYLNQDEGLTDEEEVNDDQGSVNGLEERQPSVSERNGTQGSLGKIPAFDSRSKIYLKENEMFIPREDDTTLGVLDRNQSQCEDTCSSSRSGEAGSKIENRIENNLQLASGVRSSQESATPSHNCDDVEITRVKQPREKKGVSADKRPMSDDNEDVIVLDDDRFPSPASRSILGRKRQLFLDHTVRKSPVVNVAWAGNLLHQGHRSLNSSTQQSVSSSTKARCTKDGSLKGRRSSSFSPLESLKSRFNTRAIRNNLPKSIESKSTDSSIRSPSTALSSSPEITVPKNGSKKDHNPIGSTEGAANHLVSFVTTRLGRQYMNHTRALAGECGGKLTSEFSTQTSHVIMNTDDLMYVSRNHYTMKYLYGLALGKWIVSHQWIMACLEARKLVSEERFEVKGDAELGHTDVPRMARIARETEEPRLFNGYDVVCVGAFRNSISKVQLNQLLMYCGAKVHHNASLVSKSFLKSRNLVLIVDKEDRAALDDYQAASHRPEAKVVSVEWITDSVANYQVQDLNTYEIYPM